MKKVSIAISAYNHEAFIEKAVLSVLAQRTNFDFEIIVGEDHSTDQTRSILDRLQRQYPDKIRLLSTDHNLGMIENYLRIYPACQGEYIANLDGDDYWCNENKLQKQVDFLDEHPDFAISFHSVLKIYEDGSRPSKVLSPEPARTEFELNDLLISMFIPTCSALFRNGLINEFPAWTSSLKMLDWLIFVLVARHGKIGYMDETMAVYRIHSIGLWSSMESINRLKASISFFEKLDLYLDPRYSGTIHASLDGYWKNLMDEIFEQAVAQHSNRAALEYIVSFLHSIKDFKSLPHSSRRDLFDRVYCHNLMHSFEANAYPEAWASWVGLIKNNPINLKNKGLFIIGMESAFNGRMRPVIHRITHLSRTKR